METASERKRLRELYKVACIDTSAEQTTSIRKPHQRVNTLCDFESKFQALPFKNFEPHSHFLGEMVTYMQNSPDRLGKRAETRSGSDKRKFLRTPYRTLSSALATLSVECLYL